jgi:hypothetical protein
MSRIKRKPIVSWVLSLSCVMGVALLINAQTASSVDRIIAKPSSETFQQTDGLIIPWRSGGCSMSGKIERLPTCYTVTAQEYRASSWVSIYDKEGLIWYSFDVHPFNTGYFWTEKRLGFVPFSTLTSPSRTSAQYPPVLVLRLIRESATWYEVEVNEETKETKYVLKSDRLWIRRNWDHFLADGINLYLPPNHEPLRDGPGGAIIQSSPDLKFTRVKFLRRDGDWAYVNGRELTDGRTTVESNVGWIRWKNGRKLLVGCELNNFIVPNQQQ